MLPGFYYNTLGQNTERETMGLNKFTAFGNTFANMSAKAISTLTPPS